MRSFLRYFKKLHIWLLVNAALLGLFFALRGQKRVMTAVAESFSMPIERVLGRLWSYVPVSGMELCYAGAAVFLLVFLVRSVVLIACGEYKREVLYRRFLTLVNLVLSLYAAFCLFWGVNYYADDFCDKSGIYPAAVAYEDLASVTRYFAEQTALCADEVARDANGVYVVPRAETFALAPSLYEAMYDEFPFLRIAVDPAPKPVFFSRVMSAMGFTGVYCPFTGESNLNMDFPAATFPATVAHELAHRRGVAGEQQCNFLAVLAATRSDDPAYRYSGWLLGYIYLSNALYTVDPGLWRELRSSLPASVDADLRAANDYWAQFEDKPVAKASDKVYDTMLKSYGEELGMRSYGAVVDLLVVYYR